ncbi:hypothetical protein BH11MYX4_BH11MYX4_51050 [soil metagenome]
MLGIPPAKDTDAEDVVWGLQTAETLWKRGERIDAVVWLRRAAQAAGEAADDDRALELARSAAELSDWMATGTSQPPAPVPQLPSQQPLREAQAQAPTYVPDGGRLSIEVDLNDAEGARGPLPEIVSAEAAMPVRPSRPMPPRSRPPSQPTMQTAEPTFADDTPPVSSRDRRDEARQTPMAPLPSYASDAPPREPSVPPADKVHAGMFNPWDERKSPAPPAPIAPPPPLTPRFSDDEEVITSVRPQQLHQQRADALAAVLAGGSPQSEAPPPPAPVAWAEEPKVEPPKPAPPRPSTPRPPPLPARAMKARVTSAPPDRHVPSEPPMRVTPPPPSPTQVMLMQQRAEVSPQEPVSEPEVETPRPDGEPEPVREPEPEPVREPEPEPVREPEPEPVREPVREPEPEPVREPEPEPEPVAEALREPEVLREPEPAPDDGLTPLVPPAALTPVPPAVEERPPLDLEDVEAFADLPDDARRAFASAAQVSALGEGEEVSSFALAYILSGSVDVAATMVDAPAARLEGGAVLRSRGTTDDGVPMRLIGVSSGVVATWTDAAVQEAFRTCPWVEEDLRVAADRLQTLVGVTIGPLGERLDASIRQEIIDRLTMRTLIAGEVVVTAGEQMPGLLLVGVGELELVDGDTVKGVVGSGEFLFPTEVLGAGNAPHTARAGVGGALILFGGRMIAQELLVTCPPLLELFAGM